jgi:hypothetical protein
MEDNDSAVKKEINYNMLFSQAEREKFNRQKTRLDLHGTYHESTPEQYIKYIYTTGLGEKHSREFDGRIIPEILNTYDWLKENDIMIRSTIEEILKNVRFSIWRANVVRRQQKKICPAFFKVIINVSENYLQLLIAEHGDFYNYVKNLEKMNALTKQYENKEITEEEYRNDFTTLSDNSLKLVLTEKNLLKIGEPSYGFGSGMIEILSDGDYFPMHFFLERLDGGWKLLSWTISPAALDAINNDSINT